MEGACVYTGRSLFSEGETGARGGERAGGGCATENELAEGFETKQWKSQNS